MGIFTLNPAGRQPIYEQLYQSVVKMAALGVLAENEQLPSVRSVAQELGVNVNTVQKAYRQLEEEGLIQSRPGAGSHITASPQQVAQIRRELFRTEVRDTVAAMKRMGLGKEEALDLLRRLYDEEEER